VRVFRMAGRFEKRGNVSSAEHLRASFRAAFRSPEFPPSIPKVGNPFRILYGSILDRPSTNNQNVWAREGAQWGTAGRKHR
jgi:hypothetical protein